MGTPTQCLPTLALNILRSTLRFRFFSYMPGLTANLKATTKHIGYMHDSWKHGHGRSPPSDSKARVWHDRMWGEGMNRSLWMGMWIWNMDLWWQEIRRYKAKRRGTLDSGCQLEMMWKHTCTGGFFGYTLMDDWEGYGVECRYPHITSPAAIVEHRGEFRPNCAFFIHL